MLPGVGSAGSGRRGPIYYPFSIGHGMREKIFAGWPLILKSLASTPMGHVTQASLQSFKGTMSQCP